MPKEAHSPIKDTNLNTSWVHKSGFKLLYIFLLLGAGVFLNMTFFADTGYASTAVLQLHAIVTFVLLHWNKGAPQLDQAQLESVGEEFDKMTFWEQIDKGYMGTPTRRFLSIVPIVLFFVVLMLNAKHDDLLTLFCNVVSTVALCIIPKFEALFGVRLFGVNA